MDYLGIGPTISKDLELEASVMQEQQPEVKLPDRNTEKTAE
jgi:hypothetical protein